ncbi:hypothetical protein PF005_g29896 [Phytophthora fragariae]|uniref:EF-hand domain-containing protein n=1 Tax=Phytophthora fragariae TaxID=53985 RepID=A0A6A4B5Y2_9STRA|nr:hypothetical protein PF003_g8413 [Phytophthora fragariae]KAE8919435.1 hypothetical protein PF009_g30259 [Phytophthora fragariae]KAE8963426.1 hypothetical protein PF011_g29039 [Phytophthora fragariae]KAE9061291.1 hypothetical protein PF010_g29868 [Phytophthora fragariae]KAE9063023.1 hypothetical protein PF007_g29700 [Phytophthora fragariae]
MSGYDGRTKGKRIRKPQAGNSNSKARWKYLSSDVTDVVDKPVAKLRAKARGKSSIKTGPTEKVALKLGYDIDGDGFVDVREMRLAKFLDAMLLDRRKDPLDEGPEPNEAELLAMRQSAGRILIAKEFVERNHERLWRYGSIFTGMNNEQAAQFIATHKNFKKLMPFLESTERNRTVRSSHQMRTCIHSDAAAGELSAPNSSAERQTWVETTRKLRSSSFTKHPLPDLQPKKKFVSPALNPTQLDDFEPNLATSASSPEVISNAYGAIDIDGDGIVDDDEMKMHLRLQEATGSSNNHDEMKARHFQQHEGRKMMVADFVQRNAGQMWLYDESFRYKSTEQIVDEIAIGAGFAAEFNRLRAKERLVKLKSSLGVSGCIVQLPLAELPVDPTNALEFRRVKDRSELLMARKELLKPLQQRRRLAIPGDDSAGPLHYRPRGIREEQGDMGRSKSDGSLLIGLPRIYDTPVKIEHVGTFSVTKWRLDAN